MYSNVVYNDVVYILERICLKIYMIFIFFHSCAKYNSNKTPAVSEETAGVLLCLCARSVLVGITVSSV